MKGAVHVVFGFIFCSAVSADDLSSRLDRQEIRMNHLAEEVTILSTQLALQKRKHWSLESRVSDFIDQTLATTRTHVTAEPTRYPDEQIVNLIQKLVKKMIRNHLYNLKSSVAEEKRKRVEVSTAVTLLKATSQRQRKQLDLVRVNMDNRITALSKNTEEMATKFNSCLLEEAGHRLNDSISEIRKTLAEVSIKVTNVTAPCQLLEPVDNGTLSYDDDDSVRREHIVPHNSSASLVCDDGYEPKGRRRCLHGKWTGPKFYCEPARCPGFDDKGVSQSEWAEHGGIVQVSCGEGYHIGEIPSDGEVRQAIIAQCWKGKWIPMSPECKTGTDPESIPQDTSDVVSAVLEEQKHKKQTQPAPITGPELASMMKIGTRVVRGVDWKWGDQDGPSPSMGRVIGELGEDGLIPVQWDTGSKNIYAMGWGGKYDLKLAEPLEMPDNEDEEEENSETPPEPATPMIPPGGLKAIVLSAKTIVLTWTDSTLEKSQRINDNRYYTIRYTSVPNKNRRYRYSNSTDLNIHIDDLKPNTQYEFSAKVIKGRRQSTWSLSVFNTTFESAPGSIARDLTPVPVEGNPMAVTLNWQPPQRPNGQIIGYLVLYTTDSSQGDRSWVVEDVLGDDLSTTINDLTPDTTYYFKVQPRNHKGYGPMSPTVIYRTPKELRLCALRQGSHSMWQLALQVENHVYNNSITINRLQHRPKQA